MPHAYVGEMTVETGGSVTTNFAKIVGILAPDARVATCLMVNLNGARSTGNPTDRTKHLFMTTC